MDTVVKIHSRLRACLDSIDKSGLDNMDPAIIGELEQIYAVASSLGMEQGKKLAENLCDVLKSYKEGKAGEENVSVRITALDFYLKKC